MENSMKNQEESSLRSDRGLNGPKTGFRNPEKIMNYANDIVSRVRNVSGDAMKDSIGFVKRYPVHTAIGAVAVGFVAGLLLKQRKE